MVAEQLDGRLFLCMESRAKWGEGRAEEASQASHMKILHRRSILRPKRRNSEKILQNCIISPILNPIQAIAQGIPAFLQDSFFHRVVSMKLLYFCSIVGVDEQIGRSKCSIGGVDEQSGGSKAALME
ncbi:hypothetical protein [Paenibacillus dendritiformis]|uniref:hypothetical protein n=1 Tax=Paenibacillus dendritiformis TaxID=130049 RepID=UPI001BCDE31A|nr:hypothetical protein [Paenibacillus dendritiformis]